MELDEAETASIAGGSGSREAGGRVADVSPPRDPAEAWERALSTQFRNLTSFARERDCLLTRSDLPSLDYGKGGMEHEIFHDPHEDRFWKSTFAGFAGFGPSGYSTPFGYLRRLRLSNLVFGDDVRFEGIWERPDGPSIVTSQRYILPDPMAGVPAMEAVCEFMAGLGFTRDGENVTFLREPDGVLAQDAHPRNYIRAVDGDIYAIDVQPFLERGRPWDEVRAFGAVAS